MLEDDLVLARTREGQGAAFDEVFLTRSELRLLRLFNGYTPFGEIVSRLVAGVDWRQVASELLARGFVADAAAKPADAPVRASAE